MTDQNVTIETAHPSSCNVLDTLLCILFEVIALYSLPAGLT